MNLEQIVACLGKSERDEQVVAMLTELGVKQPIPRPKGGWTDVNIIPRPSPTEIEFVFSPIEDLKNYSASFLEGELYFDTMFVRPSKDEVAKGIAMPYGVNLQESLEWHLKKLGSLEESIPDWNRYLWLIGKHHVLLEFVDNENLVIRDVTYSFNDGS